MRKTKISMVALGLLLVFSASMSINQTSAGSLNQPNQLSSNVSAGYAIFKDNDAWGFNVITTILNANSIPYSVFTSAEIGIADISGYEKVIIESDQTQSFNDAVISNNAYFEAYASNGGILEIHSGTNSYWSSPLPGGFVYNVKYPELVNITDPSHPVLYQPWSITDDELDSWSASAHGVLTGLLPGDKEILSGQEFYNDVPGPVLVERRSGSGVIIISTQTLEHGYGNSFSNFLENLLLYMPRLNGVAIFRDTLAWGFNGTSQILEQHGIQYTEYTSNDIGFIDLSSFVKVIIEGDQNQQFNDAVLSNRTYFENFANDGGILEIHSATNSQWNSLALPGNFYYNPASPNLINITDPSHSVLNSPNVITENELNNWDASAHGILNGIQAGDTVILQSFDTAPVGPVLVDRAFGNGRIIISSQTLEYGYGNSFSSILENIILFRLPIPIVPLTGPTLNYGPVDTAVEFGSTFSLYWNFADDNPDFYELFIDGVLETNGIWASASDIVYNFGYITIGYHEIKIIVQDLDELSFEYIFYLTVVDTTDPSVVAPTDMEYIIGSTGNELRWTASDPNPGSYDVWIDGVYMYNSIWSNGVDIVVNVDGLSLGIHTVEINIYDYTGNDVYYLINVKVVHRVVTSDPTSNPTSQPVSSNPTSDPTTRPTSDASSDPISTPAASSSEPALPVPFASNILIILSLISIGAVVRRVRR